MKWNVLNEIKKIDKEIQHNIPHKHTSRSTPLDTCLKFAPLAILFASDASGAKTKNDFKKHALHIIAAEMILNAVALPLKKSVDRKRPNGKPKSFPSGHTATSFAGAELLFEELKETDLALSYSGYALSVITAMLRLYHNKHWFSDVLTGALIGVFSVKLTRKLPDYIINAAAKQHSIKST